MVRGDGAPLVAKPRLLNQVKHGTTTQDSESGIKLLEEKMSQQQYRSIPVYPETLDRFRQYKLRMGISSYDAAVNAVLDDLGFSSAAELEELYECISLPSDIQANREKR